MRLCRLFVSCWLCACLVLTVTGQPQSALPSVVFDNFGPGIREQVRKAYNEARAQPDSAPAVGQLGMVLHTYEDHETAALCYQRARQLAPQEFRWHYLLATAQLALGQQREAGATLRAALQLEPTYLPAQLKLAEALFAAGEWAASQQLYETLKPTGLAQVAYGLGRLAAAHRNPAAAVTQLRQAVASFPEYGAAHYALALALRESGEQERAAEHLALYQRCKNNRPPLPDKLLAEVAALNVSATERLRQGVQLEAAGKLAESIALHEEALALNSQLTQAHINLIQLYGRTGQPRQAEAHYRALLALAPTLAEGHYNFGVLLVEQRRFAEAETAFRRALECNPQFATAHLNLGTLLEQQQKYDDALQHYRQAVEQQPNLRLAHFQLARMLIYQGRLPEAINHLQQILTPVDEQSPRYSFALAAAYARQGERAKALAQARRARELARAYQQTELLNSIERDIKLLEQPQ